jgi:hypothetical protein
MWQRCLHVAEMFACGRNVSSEADSFALLTDRKALHWVLYLFFSV